MIYSQDKLSKLTFSLVDTSKSKKEQAKEIYNWITYNIKYDTKQLTKGVKNNTSKEVINKKKTICYGYARLFHDMCKIVNIESYIINGYSKGFGYVKNENFIKSDHSWNSIYVDSNWVIIDPTWGSGYLYYDYSIKDKIKSVFNKNIGIKSKIVFKQNPIDLYFDISPKEIIKTHYPIDSKWQFRNYPISYKTFITDTFEQTHYLNFNYEISLIRNKDISTQIFTDALNSIKYNPFNKFDIGYQYYYQANQLRFNRRYSFDSTLIPMLNMALAYIDSSQSYLKKFKNISNIHYRDKKKKLKSIYKPTTFTLRNINKIPTTFNYKFNRENDRLLKHEKKLEKVRFSAYNSNLKVSILKEYNYPIKNIFDSSHYFSYKSQIVKDSIKLFRNLSNVYILSENINNTNSLGIYQNDSISFYLNKSAELLLTINHAIDKMDEFLVFSNCKKLTSLYYDYFSFYKSKKMFKSNLFEDYYNFLDLFEKLEKSINSIISYYEKLAKLTGNNSLYFAKTKFYINLLNNLYDTKIKTVNIIKQNNDSWKNLMNEQNIILSIYGSKGISRIEIKLTDYYNYILSKNEKTHLNDLKIYDLIKIDSRKKETLIKNIIKEINNKPTLANTP